MTMEDKNVWLFIKNDMVIRMSNKAIGMNELNKVFNFTEKIFDKYEAQLKVKNNEINILKAQLAIQTAKTKVQCEAKNFNDDMFWKVQKLAVQNRQKSRSIVAMLFWNAKRKERIYKISVQSDNAWYCFEKAYAMLKDKQ